MRDPLARFAPAGERRLRVAPKSAGVSSGAAELEANEAAVSLRGDPTCVGVALRPRSNRACHATTAMRMMFKNTNPKMTPLRFTIPFYAAAELSASAPA